MRTILLASILVAAACGDDGSSLPLDARQVDAPVVAIDARIDAPAIVVDAPIDGPVIPANVTTACTNICTALGVCAMDSDPTCVAECSEDLLDCTVGQVSAVDACSNAKCGDFENEKEESPMFVCLTAVTCIDM